MTDLPGEYLSYFPVQYHMHQVASGAVEHATSGFERRRTDIYFGRSFDAARNGGEDTHNAIDIMGAVGLRIVAACSGVVVETWRAGREERPGIGRSATDTDGGHYVMMRDNQNDYFHYYAHLSAEPLVNEGDEIRSGQLLGFLGNTGIARHGPPHLHYQVSRRDPKRGSLRDFVNPLNELIRLARRWNPAAGRRWRTELPVSCGGPTGLST